MLFQTALPARTFSAHCRAAVTRARSRVYTRKRYVRTKDAANSRPHSGAWVAYGTACNGHSLIHRAIDKHTHFVASTSSTVTSVGSSSGPIISCSSAATGLEAEDEPLTGVVLTEDDPIPAAQLLPMWSQPLLELELVLPLIDVASFGASSFIPFITAISIKSRISRREALRTKRLWRRFSWGGGGVETKTPSAALCCVRADAYELSFISVIVKHIRYADPS